MSEPRNASLSPLSIRQYAEAEAAAGRPVSVTAARARAHRALARAGGVSADGTIRAYHAHTGTRASLLVEYQTITNPTGSVGKGTNQK